MLNSTEKRFIQTWKEQRDGPKWQYYLQYILAWGVVIFLVLFFLLKLIIEDKSMGGIGTFYIIIAVSILLASLITHIVYTINEKRYHKILQQGNITNINQ